MKKITLSVAALSIAISGFSTNLPTKQELIKEVSMTTEDMIKSMRMTNDTVTHCYSFVKMSEIYIVNLLDILSKLEDLQTSHTDTIKQEVNYSDYINVNLVNSIDCMNCDEID